MRFQRNSIILVALLSSFGVTVPAAPVHKDIQKMTVAELKKLDPSSLTGEQKRQLFYVALFSGLEHKQGAARKVLSKLKGVNIRDWNKFKQKVIDAGLNEKVLTNLKDQKKREEIKQHYKDGWFSGLEHKKQKAQNLLKSKGFKVDDKLRKQVIDSGLFAALGAEVMEEELAPVVVSEEIATTEEEVALVKEAAQEGQVTLKMPSPIANETGHASVPLTLDDDETFTQETFKELIDNNAQGYEVATVFTQDNGNWFAHNFDAASYRQYGQQSDPVNRLPARHVQYTTLVKQNGQYKAL